MYIGQQIVFDEEKHSGVYQRVYDKIDIVNDIYANPAKYDAETLEHHTSVALRELEMLVNGQITVVEIVKEINANIEIN